LALENVGGDINVPLNILHDEVEGILDLLDMLFEIRVGSLYMVVD